VPAPRSCPPAALAALIAGLLGACDGAPPPAPAAPPPAAAPAGPPKDPNPAADAKVWSELDPKPAEPEGPVDEPVDQPRADPAAARCPLHFSSGDANAAFGPAGALPGPCAFTGVHALGSALELRFKAPDGAPVKAVLHPLGCGQGEPAGELTLELEPALAACGPLADALRAAARDGRLPTGRPAAG
jgi:hypothetical protein